MGQDVGKFKILHDSVQQNDSSLTMVKLNGKRVGDKRVVKLAQALRHNDTVEELELEDCDLSHVGVVHLCDTLCSVLITTNIRRLVLDANPKVGSEGGRLVADMLKNNTQLQELHLNECGLTDVGLAPIAFALQDNQTLLSLEVGQNSLKDESAQHICEMLKLNSSLEGLSLFQNQVTEEGAKFLAEALSTNRCLSWLGLGNNFIGVEGAWALCEGIRPNGSLQWLALGGNSIGDRGATHMATLLSSNQSGLLSLGLGSNRVTSDGAASLARALQRNSRLASLGLQDNHIGSDGAKDLADMLRVNRTLKTLMLSANQIDDQGGLQLAASLSSNCTLDTLHLANNPVGDETAAALSDVLCSDNHSLSRLDVRGTAMSKGAEKRLQAALRRESQVTQLAVGPSERGRSVSVDTADGVASSRDIAMRQGMRQKQSISGISGGLDMY